MSLMNLDKALQEYRAACAASDQADKVRSQAFARYREVSKERDTQGAVAPWRNSYHSKTDGEDGSFRE